MALELIYLDKERIARRGDKLMSGAEKLEEVVWLLDGGTHPDHIAAQLGTDVAALMKLARRQALSARLAAAQVRHDRGLGQGERQRAS